MAAVMNRVETAPAARRLRPAVMVRLSTIWEAFRVAASSLRQNKLRTSLTLIGIIVGVTAVIAVVTIIKGLDQTVAQTFSSQGSTVFTISKKPRVITSREEFIKLNKRKSITEEDAEAIFRLCTACWRTGVSTVGSDTRAGVRVSLPTVECRSSMAIRKRITSRCGLSRRPQCSRWTV